MQISQLKTIINENKNTYQKKISSVEKKCEERIASMDKKNKDFIIIITLA